MEQRKEQLRDLLSASKEDIDKLVRRNPSVIICSDIEKNHGHKLKLLQERLGISEKAAGQMCVNRNRLLGISLATLEARADWLQTRFNLNKTQLRIMVEREPDVLIVSIENNLEPTTDKIQSDLELSDEELTKMVVRKPQVLTQCADNMMQRISLLQKMLDLPEGEIGSLRRKCIESPPLLFWSEKKMEENQQWIQQRFGLGDAKIAQMCRNRPSDMLFSKISTLEEKTASIQADLSLSDEELSDLVSKYPQILGYCPEKNLRPKLRYLRTRFELDDDALKNLVLKAPSLLAYGDVEEKLQFYSNLVGEKQAKRLVVERYNLLNQSLKNRLKPRLEEVEISGVKVRWNETLIQRLAGRTKSQWEAYGLGEAKMGRPKD